MKNQNQRMIVLPTYDMTLSHDQIYFLFFPPSPGMEGIHLTLHFLLVTFKLLFF